MADCWWMFGEGQADYLGILEGADFSGKDICAICSIIKFDQNILDKYKYSNINYREFYGYLNTIKKDESSTYYNYLYPSNNINAFFNSQYTPTINPDLDLIIGDEGYAIVTGVQTKLLSLKEMFILVSYIKTDDLTLEMKDGGLSCDEFITKAA
jgi:hypothetical protein